MKKLFKPLLLLSALICFAACDPEGPTKPVLADEGSSNQELRPRLRAPGKQSPQTSFVTPDDIRSFVEKDYPQTRAGLLQDVSVDPYIDPNGTDTLMYIVKYPDNDGWKILSSDARTPAILAEGKSGSFSLNDGDGAVAAWISTMATDMKRVRNASDQELCFSDLEIRCNKAFWTRGGGHDFFIIDDEPGGGGGGGGGGGQWVVTTTSETELVDSLAHMTPQWSQTGPYNQYCPLYINTGPQGRAYAGCVAVAGANVLYYLHNKIGVPSQMVTQAQYIGNDNEWVFSNPSSTIWASMDTTSHAGNPFSDRPEALMIGYIGKTINMHYGADFSWALPANLRTQLFNPAGISCSHGDYDQSIVAASLSNLMPVIITASDQLIPINGRIHTFVADGYLRTRIKYTTLHHWSGPIPDVNPEQYEDYYTYSYSTPTVSSIKFNWGWSTQWDYPSVNDGWFALTGGWTVNNLSFASR